MLLLFAIIGTSLMLTNFLIEMINSEMDIDFYYSTFLV